MDKLEILVTAMVFGAAGFLAGMFLERSIERNHRYQERAYIHSQPSQDYRLGQ